MTDRFAEKVRRQRRRRHWRIAAAVLVIAMLAAGGWAVWFSPWLEVRTVDVEGIEHLTRARVLDAAAVPESTPLPRVDLAAIAERVEKLPPVESARAERDLPHTVRIVVTERTAAAWIDRDGTPWAVDASGVVYRSLQSKPNHIPELKVDASDERTVAAAARVAADIAGSSVAGDLQSITAETRDSITLDLTEGRTVVWGSAEQSDAKLQVLVPLVKIDARVYDVSAPERPTTLQ